MNRDNKDNRDSKDNKDNIELRSEDFQDVLGGVPPWILRWGITMIAAIVLILFIGSSIFKYPDIISSVITLTGSTPPAAIVARSTGKITELYISDNQQVKAGENLAVIDNPAYTQDVLFLKNYLYTLNPDQQEAEVSLPPKNLMLGNLQSSFWSFYLTLFEYMEYRRLQYYTSKIEILSERVKHYEKQYENTLRQQKIIKEQLSITNTQFQRDSLLHTRGVISHEVFEGSEIQYLQAHLSYENICSSLDNMQIQIAQIKESIFETRFQSTEKENGFQSQLRTLISQLQNDIQSWEMSYVLTSPIDGKITFTNYWVTNQHINTGDVVFNIIPDENVQLIGKASLPATRSGKVKIGQKVNVRFDNFPDNEYGMVKGEVKNISLVPIKSNEIVNYMVEIELPQGLKTTYNKELPYLPEMQGSADIITDDITLLERFIMPIKKVLKEGLE